MPVSKAERYEQETAIFQMRSEGGLQTLRAWLFAHRDATNLKWPDLAGEDLNKAQGEAKLVNRLIKMIDQGPAIKSIEERRNG